MSLTKLSLSENKLIIPARGEFGKWHPGWGRECRLPFFYSAWRGENFTWGVLNESRKSCPSFGSKKWEQLTEVLAECCSLIRCIALQLFPPPSFQEDGRRCPVSTACSSHTAASGGSVSEHCVWTPEKRDEAGDMGGGGTSQSKTGPSIGGTAVPQRSIGYVVFVLSSDPRMVNLCCTVKKLASAAQYSTQNPEPRSVLGLLGLLQACKLI